jgi:hypothetical protein
MAWMALDPRAVQRSQPLRNGAKSSVSGGNLNVKLLG